MFTPVDKNLFFSRHDSGDVRRGETVRTINSLDEAASAGFIIAGYPDDEGIRNNGGRAGASQGPTAIRSFLYRMTTAKSTCYDIGDLCVANARLPERHETARQSVSAALKSGHRWIGLGGGHDYAYADGAGFLDWSKSLDDVQPIIINFDAHLDVRPVSGEINSGTAFNRLTQHKQSYDFVQVGIQRQCNSEEHLNWSRGKNHIIITLDDYWNSHVSLDEYLIRQLGDLLINKRPCFLSVDADAFAWPYSIGTSQSWPTGLEPKEFWPCLEILLRRWDVRVLGIYETSPPLDFDFGTAKLAALIADTFLRGHQI